jgi:hypothetical protein
MVRSQDAEDGEMMGHALMASCPSESAVAAAPSEPQPQRMPDGVGMQDIMRLLDLSSRLPLDGEITPVMAWVGIWTHPRLHQLEREDFELLKANLKPKIRCYGYVSRSRTLILCLLSFAISKKNSKRTQRLVMISELVVQRA